MKYVRTTVTLDADFHEELRLRSVKEKKSMGKLIEEKFRSKAKKWSRKN